ncbi:hypothetical protein SZ64_09755 [Erythrobacter sp. SG61-1L]|uniref:cytochrome c n=1 Tax=Erythrobacter sp. SG61-1L TaxID=1603897 RepID=UPI0006C90242|nr:cytochrome c [Erythrobacter sp. SG61-1L]KPL68379.1 hypothetical protein SZ64_09755 [Erythrobacter sp. SG61-1L]
MKLRLASLLVLVTFAAGCSSQEPAAEESGALDKTVHEMMIERIDPDADAIWEIGNAAIDDQASIDPALMDDKTWTALAEASARMAGHATDLSKLDPLKVTRPGVKIADEGTEGAPTPDQIQAHMDRDADVFRALAESLASHSTDLAAAAKAHDAVAAGKLINEMDGVCEACHLEFWYPEQKAIIEQMGLLPK